MTKIDSLFYYRANIVAVYDGDTVTAVVDLGFRMTFEMKIRLAGINAPEMHGDHVTEATASRDYLRSLILNKEVIIQTMKDKQEKYGRYLGKIWLDDLLVNDDLVAKGYAVPFMVTDD